MNLFESYAKIDIISPRGLGFPHLRMYSLALEVYTKGTRFPTTWLLFHLHKAAMSA